jgi:hypothetical protein
MRKDFLWSLRFSKTQLQMFLRRRDCSLKKPSFFYVRRKTTNQNKHMSMFGKLFGSKEEASDQLKKSVQVAKACVDVGKTMGAPRSEEEMKNEICAALAKEHGTSPQKVRALYEKS